MARLAKKEDFDFVKSTWAKCFEDTKKFVDWNFEYNYSADNTIIEEAENTLASVLQIMPYKISIENNDFNMRYVSGVATLPQYRGRGLVRSLFEYALPEMYSRGCDISILIPAVDGMYEKFGYRTICSRNMFSVKSTDGFDSYNKKSEDLIQRLDKLYKKDMENKSVYIQRSYEDWEKILTDLLDLSRGQVLMSGSGYALVYPKGDALEATEICGGIRLDATPVSAPPVMARVINAESMMKRLGITCSVKDDFISENNIGDKGEDIAALTKMLFEKKSAYINLLL